MSFFDYFNVVLPVALFLALFISWSNINARFLILIYGFVEVINLLSLDWAMSMPIGYYAWCMFMNVLFLVFVFGRRYWAYKLSYFSFFDKAFDEHKYSLQETTLVLLFSLSFLINFITLVEVYLYYIGWFNNAYIKLYVRDLVQTVLHIMASIVCITFALRFSSNIEGKTNGIK
ncbi:hypothetical protein N473_12920 [Pseudoalteromonas luteoviolacea CPMOR-1]|uniref:Uncharacterized protein n=1 Tax=Pseudoalteromonas luteoviolacea CPMOR-1 TaxID=1365248 RepID=A0A161Z8H5_9GAMM|nr:hypothetical protein [Pseudoalteromonas luteoviolacea]KZN64934.1 hypothetical protein N473_12920 [Pseudoalteromonas luteoviolacea CPMOR-1]